MDDIHHFSNPPQVTPGIYDAQDASDFQIAPARAEPKTEAAAAAFVAPEVSPDAEDNPPDPKEIQMEHVEHHHHDCDRDDNIVSAIAASDRLNMARFDADAQRDIQSCVERTAAATQLASQVSHSALGVLVAKGDGELSTQIALNTAAVATAVERTGTASALAFKDAALQTQASTTQVLQSIVSDGDKTRELITRNYQDTLNRQLSDANNLIAELRNEGHSRRFARETEVSVVQTVNQNQAQAQQQQQAILNERICSALNALQVATATNQQLIIGNSGITTGGAQTANPVNVRA